MTLNHIDLQVSDVEASRAFFETHFGLKVTYRRGSQIALLKDEQGLLLGVSNLFGSPAPRYPKDFHIGFRLDDEAKVHATYEELKAAGVPIKGEPTVGGPALYFMCTSPDGIAIEVSGPRAGMEDAYRIG